MEKINLLQKISENTAPKMSRCISVTNDETDSTTKFNPPIELDKNKSYEMALINLETYYSFPNIDAKRNYVKYSPNGGTTWFNFRLPVGCYVLKEINEAIQIKDNEHSEEAVVITANTVTLKTILKLNNGYQVDFSGADSIGKVLGFKPTC